MEGVYPVCCILSRYSFAEYNSKYASTLKTNPAPLDGSTYLHREVSTTRMSGLGSDSLLTKAVLLCE